MLKMTRKGLEQIIKLRSDWAVDKRKGDYALPSGGMLSEYLFDLLTEQLDVDHLGFTTAGELVTYDKENKRLIMPFARDEETNWGEQYKRKIAFVHDMVWGHKIYGA